ncbi:uncharacterized protein SPSK_05116 [Sporothrix schenckii 1099-18]|uniref:Subtelomeric hrmA-associated cluster protein AFUB-079030/YDR124W-like helical bundle domain-containing protein n=1 Tax=Sporothrix schenckii 1099-18 TaxID=1397361 RepID=A0A0F2LTF7_SPOSC|nr:uncharacterized protein SPSK_05116 [Sporothrix schenckii 1099-18]KJR80763.1 hypothetical protein SPSK_05116 [Sporothrix schenckii 1099-18]
MFSIIVGDLLPAPDSVYEDHLGHSRSRSRQPQSQGSSQVLGQQGLEYEGRRSGYDRRRIQGMDEFDEDIYRNRKRARGTASRRIAEMAEERPVRVTQPTKIPIRISEEQAIWNIYDQRFRGLQQTACKLIAKAWVKLVEPKKQSTHPYTGSDEKAPDWWPKPWGTTRDEKVRHKEPDHLYKKERVHLLKHILRMIVLPNSEQHPDIQKLNLNVAKLEEATMEVLSSFFTDKDSPNNIKKKPYLKEIFLLAKYEERFRNGEIDATTNVYIMSEDKIPDNYTSENDESAAIKEDEDQEVLRGPVTISPRRPMPGALIAPARATTSAGVPMSANTSTPSHNGDHSPGTGMPTGAGTSASHPFMGELPHRNHPTYPPSQLMHPDLGANDQHAAYVDGGSLAVSNSPGHHHHSAIAEGHGGVALQQMVTNPHETNRRSSIFSPTTEYNNTPTSTSMYQTWQQGSNAPSASPLYAFTPQQAQIQPQTQAQHAQHGSFVPQGPVGMPPQSHGYMSHGFEQLPRNTYETTSHDSIYRQSNVPPGAVNPQGNYSMPLAPQDSRALPGHNLKPEPPNRGLLH